MIDPNIKNRETDGFRISFHWVWFDLWVGFYYNPATHILYFCPLPTVVIKIQLKKEETKE